MSLRAAGLMAMLAGPMAVPAASAQDGRLDPDFGAGSGFVVPDLSTTPGEYSGQAASGAGFDAQGRLIVAGTLVRASDGARDCFVLRLLASGEIDTSFSPPDGFRTVSVGVPALPNELCTSVIALPDGRIAIGGAATDAAVTRYTAIVAVLDASGAFDPGFYGNGVFVAISDLPQTDLPDTASAIERLQLDSAGRLLASGSFFGTGGTFSQQGLLLRFLPSEGTLDDGFGGEIAPGLVFLSDGSNGNNFALSGVAEDDLGRVLVAGSAGNRLKLFALRDDGSLDPAFGEGMTPDGGGGVGYIPNCVAASDFLIDAQQRWWHACMRVDAATSERQAGVLRTFANGEPDLDFGSDGFGSAPLPDAIGRFDVGRLALQDDGRVLMSARYFIEASSLWDLLGRTDVFALRLDVDGQLDTSFGVEPGFSLFRFGDVPPGAPGDNRSEIAQALLLDGSGRALLIGYRPDNAGTRIDMVIARLTRAAPLPDEMFRDGFE
jgi:uncharacterized delta-60 repeat protein